MSIEYAILGLLSWKPFTGYELKKVFEESSTMYWSGNNNQIYKAMVRLSDEGLVTSEVLHREGSPSKKIYTITDEGLAELRQWVLGAPEAPEIKKTFLVQLAWADQISNEELYGLLSRYENEIKMQLLLHQEKSRRNQTSPARNPRETFLWNMIDQNLASSYKCELEWIGAVRRELFKEEIIEEKSRMNYMIVEKEAQKYIELESSEAKLGSEQDALDMIALCGENDTSLLMIHSDALDEGFFRLKTGVAGRMLQKFVNYYVKTAVLLKEQNVNARFRELVSESNKGSQFGVFETRETAEEWLLKDK